MYGFLKGFGNELKQKIAGSFYWNLHGVAAMFLLVAALLILNQFFSPPAMAMESPGKTFEPVMPLFGFKKGNLHTHSLRSDGDSAPSTVVKWYRDHGYQFMALTDHNTNFTPGEFAELETSNFHVLQGEEASYGYRNTPGRTWYSVHVNSFCTTQTVGGHEGPDATSTLLRAVHDVRSRGGIPQVNHPNFEYALTLENLMNLSGSYLMEVANQHPFVNNEGRPANASRHEDARLSTTQLWDELLSAGKTVYGTATDDIHDLVGNPGFTPRRPGRGWVQVAAPSFDNTDICAALAAGRFYFSTGVEFESISVAGAQLELRIRSSSFPITTRFIGRGGEVLETSTTNVRTAVVTKGYQIRGDEMYVRAEVSDATGKKAWTQAFHIR